MFLCSHCRTEQNAREIEYKKLKDCLCPNCHEVCCDDYCVFFENGRWNFPDCPEYPYDASREEMLKAEAVYQKDLEAFMAKYEATKREYGIEPL